MLVGVVMLIYESVSWESTGKPPKFKCTSLKSKQSSTKIHMPEMDARADALSDLSMKWIQMEWFNRSIGV